MKRKGVIKQNKVRFNHNRIKQGKSSFKPSLTCLINKKQKITHDMADSRNSDKLFLLFSLTNGLFTIL